jgi:hypothetical protein
MAKTARVPVFHAADCNLLVELVGAIGYAAFLAAWLLA